MLRIYHSIEMFFFHFLFWAAASRSNKIDAKWIFYISIMPYQCTNRCNHVERNYTSFLVGFEDSFSCSVNALTYKNLGFWRNGKINGIAAFTYISAFVYFSHLFSWRIQRQSVFTSYIQIRDSCIIRVYAWCASSMRRWWNIRWQRRKPSKITRE